MVTSLDFCYNSQAGCVLGYTIFKLVWVNYTTFVDKLNKIVLTTF